MRIMGSLISVKDQWPFRNVRELCCDDLDHVLLVTVPSSTQAI